jgi:tetratricopeptide (TPR) repeat protein
MEPIAEGNEPETPTKALSSDASTLRASRMSFIDTGTPFKPTMGSPITPTTLGRTTNLDESDIALIELWRRDAVSKYNAQLFDKAEKLFEKILELSGAGGNFPWKDETLRMLTSCYYHQSKWEEAEEMLPVQFKGRDELVGEIVKSYCYHQMWENAENVVRCFVAFEKKRTIVVYVATSYLRHKMFDEAQRILNENMEEGMEDTLEGSNMLHTLAEVYFSSKEFDKALNYCRQAVRGRRTAVGNYHILYYQSMRLRVEIYKCTGESDEAEICKKFLPDNFESMRLQISCLFQVAGNSTSSVNSTPSQQRRTLTPAQRCSC